MTPDVTRVRITRAGMWATNREGIVRVVEANGLIGVQIEGMTARTFFVAKELVVIGETEPQSGEST